MSEVQDLRAALEAEIFTGGPRIDTSNQGEAPEQFAAESEVDERQVEPEQVETKEEPKQETVDPWAGVAPALREKLDTIGSALDNFNVRMRTTEGRVGALQSELAKKAAAEAKVMGDDAPSQKQIDAAKKDDESWNELKEDFPEWAEALQKKLTESKESLSSKFVSKDDIATVIKQTRNELEKEIADRIERRVVSARHPGYEETLKTSDFWAWFQVQPEDIRMKGDSTKAEDAIAVLDAYKLAKQTPKDVVKNERQKRLEQATSIRGVPEKTIKSESDMSPEELREHMAKKIWKV